MEKDLWVRELMETSRTIMAMTKFTKINQLCLWHSLSTTSWIQSTVTGPSPCPLPSVPQLHSQSPFNSSASRFFSQLFHLLSMPPGSPHLKPLPILLPEFTLKLHWWCNSLTTKAHLPLLQPNYITCTSQNPPLTLQFLATLHFLMLFTLTHWSPSPLVIICVHQNPAILQDWSQNSLSFLGAVITVFTNGTGKCPDSGEAARIPLSGSGLPVP